MDTIFTPYKQSIKSIVSLIFISTLAGFLWRLEIEHHGWRSLDWIYYFHWAIPAAIFIFVFWANSISKISWKKRIQANFAIITYGVLFIHLFIFVMNWRYARGFVFWKPLFITSNLFIYLSPIVIFFLLHLFKLNPKWTHLIISIVGIILSIPLSIHILEITNHIGSPDFIHCIKSGIIIPIWMFFIGLLFIGIEECNKHKKIFQSDILE